MPRLRVAPIVEGHGEACAIRPLIDRVWRELLGGSYVEVLRPIRQPRTRLVGKENLQNAVKLAAKKIQALPRTGEPELLLILLDADNDPACILGPGLLEWAREARSDANIACVLANKEFETWFVAAAESLDRFLTIAKDEIPADPEGTRCGKSWIQKRIYKAKYSETVDQPAMTATMNLALCRNRSPSFDKFCRELEKFLPEVSTTT